MYIVIKKYGVTGLVFNIDAIDGKKLVKFAAMQQNRATLIYDFMNERLKGELP